jgi:hypothetical protein
MQVIAWMARHGNRPRLCGMTEMTMTSGLANLSPAVGFDEFDDGAYLDPKDRTRDLGCFFAPLRESPP